MQLFGGKFVFEGGYHPDSNFDSLGSALIVALQLLTASGWSFVMFDGMRAAGEGWATFFVLSVWIGKYVFAQMLTAILISKLPETNYLDREEV